MSDCKTDQAGVCICGDLGHVVESLTYRLEREKTAKFEMYERARNAERLVTELRCTLDGADCTQREGGDTRHCRVDQLCWRCRAERAEREWDALGKGLMGGTIAYTRARAFAVCAEIAEEHARRAVLGGEMSSALFGVEK